MKTGTARCYSAIATLAAVAGLLVVGPAPARAAGPGWVESEAAAVNRFCGVDQTTLNNITEVSTISGVGIYKPDTARNVRVGERFLLHIWSVDVSSCVDGEVRPAIRLPDGVRLDTSLSQRVACLRYESDNPANLTNLNSVCSQSPSSSGGFLVVSPQGSSAADGWELNPSADEAENVIEIQLAVVADTAGTKTLDGRICDLFAQQTVAACGGTPPANAAASMQFVVDPAVPGSGGSNPEFGASAPSHIEYNVPFQTANTPLTITTQSYVNAARQGRFRIELARHPLSTTPQVIYVEESGTFAPGADYSVEAVYENDDDIKPWTGYQGRTCFVETGGATACGDWRFVSTSMPTTLPSNPAPTYGPRRTLCWGGSCHTSRSVTLTTALTGARAAGQLFVEVENDGEIYQFEASDPVQAERSGSVSGSHTAQVLVGTAVRHRACYHARMTRPVLVTRGPSAYRCTGWRTDTVPA